jgi:DNA-binding NarL/FixJ family response regulator
MIRVLIADDHQLFRQGLRQLLELEPDIEVVGEVGDGLKVQEAVENLKPDVVLMDINMPTVDGVAATREIVRSNPNIGVIILTMYKEDSYVFQAIRAGARGYLLKSASSSEVVDAVRAVYRGASLLDPMMTTKVLKEFRRLSETLGADDGLGGLTETEIKILKLVAAGLSNRDIARELNFAESTVKNKLSVLFEKINVEDRTQAAIYAITHGIMPEWRYARNLGEGDALGDPHHQ